MGYKITSSIPIIYQIIVKVVIDPVVDDNRLRWWGWRGIMSADAVDAMTRARSSMSSSSGDKIAVAMRIVYRLSEGL